MVRLKRPGQTTVGCVSPSGTKTRFACAPSNATTVNANSQYECGRVGSRHMTVSCLSNAISRLPQRPSKEPRGGLGRGGCISCATHRYPGCARRALIDISPAASGDRGSGGSRTQRPRSLSSPPLPSPWRWFLGDSVARRGAGGADAPGYRADVECVPPHPPSRRPSEGPSSPPLGLPGTARCDGRSCARMCRWAG